MNHRIVSTLLCMLIIGPIWASNEWRCVAHDKEKNEWIGKNAYERVAANKAIEACKKQSSTPISCIVAHQSCAYFVEGKNVGTDPMSDSSLWQCTSLDQKAIVWKGEPSESRDDAALAAKHYCEEHSAIPDTCYINLLMCRKL